MTVVSSIKVKIVRRPTLKLKVLPRFPSSVSVEAPILLSTVGGNYAFSFDPTGIATSLLGTFQPLNATLSTVGDGGTSGYHLQSKGLGIPATWEGFKQSGTGAVTRTWQNKLRENIFSVFDFGAVGDGITDDTTAIQNAINATQAGGTQPNRSHGKLWAPPGYVFKITSGLIINQPIDADFGSPIEYAATSGAALTFNSVAPATYGSEQANLRFAGFKQTSSGNSATPASVNGSGATGIRVNYLNFSYLEIGAIQGFTNIGLYLDGSGGVYAPQVIQHDQIRLGQVINCGYGIYTNSLNAATSSTQVCYVYADGVYQCFTCVRMDNAASDSFTFEFVSVDNCHASGYGVQCFGKWNTFRIGYTAAPVRFESGSAHNTAYVGNTLATGASYVDVDGYAVSANKFFSGGADWATQAGSYIRLDQIGIPTADVSMNGHKLAFVADPAGPQEAATKSYVDTADALRLAKASNLSDVASAVSARSNLAAAPFDALAFNGMQINGSCEISQERGTASFTLTTAVESYVQDGWTAKMVRAATLVINAFPNYSATAPTGFQAGVLLNTGTALASLAAGDYGYLSQPIEGYRVSRLDLGKATAQSLTIGFWVNTTIAGTMTVAFQNSAATRTYPVNVTISNASTWEYKTVTISGDTTGTWLYTNGIGLRVILCFGSGSTNQGTPNQWNADGKFATSSTTNFFASTNNNMLITGLIVIPGTEVPTAARSQFIARPADTELALCQRYYQKSFPQGTVVAQNAGVAGAVTVKNPIALGDPSEIVYFAPTMRITPTITTYNPSAANANWRDITAAADVTVSVNPGSTLGDRSVLLATSGTVTTLGDILAIHFSADARL